MTSNATKYFSPRSEIDIKRCNVCLTPIVLLATTAGAAVSTAATSPEDSVYATVSAKESVFFTASVCARDIVSAATTASAKDRVSATAAATGSGTPSRLEEAQHASLGCASCRAASKAPYSHSARSGRASTGAGEVRFSQGG